MPAETQEVPSETPLSPISGDEKSKLERLMKERPKQQELVERNILKDGSVAPALQAARDKLQRSQLEDKLENDLQSRPSPDELIKRGILGKDEIPTST